MNEDQRTKTRTIENVKRSGHLLVLSREEDDDHDS